MRGEKLGMMINDEIKIHVLYTSNCTKVYICCAEDKEEIEEYRRLIANSPAMYKLISDAMKRCKGRGVYADLFERAEKLLARINGE